VILEVGPRPAFVLGGGALVLVRIGADALLVSAAGAETHLWVRLDGETKAALVRFLTEERTP
jgi:hypothetical protein